MKIEFSISKTHIVHWISELFLSNGEVKFQFRFDERVYGDARGARSNMQVGIKLYTQRALIIESRFKSDLGAHDKFYIKTSGRF